MNSFMKAHPGCFVSAVATISLGNDIFGIWNNGPRLWIEKHDSPV
jgi:hypothetical protein